jgi:hypothetical protein
MSSATPSGEAGVTVSIRFEYLAQRVERASELQRERCGKRPFPRHCAVNAPWGKTNGAAKCAMVFTKAHFDGGANHLRH